jgi:glycosyltransferase involved in cell wall biosynthesis
MDMNSRLSVIVPVYNAKEYLHRCIDSILGQTYSNFELMLIDDGSTDGSLKICEEYATRDSRVKVFHEKNSGPSSARNIGLRNVSGKYLAFVDADDWLEPDMYSVLIRELEDSNADMVVSNWYKNEEGSNASNKVNIGVAQVLSASQLRVAISEDNCKFGGGYPWNRVIDIEKIKNRCDKTIWFRENLTYYEDKIWVIEISKYMKNVRISDYAGYHYVIHDDSISHTLATKQCENIILAWNVICDLLAEDISNKALSFRDGDCRFAIWLMYKNKDRNLAALYFGEYYQFFLKLYWISRPKNIVKTLLLMINFMKYRV